MKNLSTFLEKDNLDEIVFSNRNKAYGAYVLRNEYSNQLTKALFVGVVFFASLSVMPLVISAFSSNQDTIIATVCPIGPVILDNVDTPDIPETAPMSSPQDVKTVINPIFKPVRDLKNDKPVPTKQDYDGAAIGDEIKTGPKTDISYVPPVVTSGPPAITYTPLAKPTDDPDKIRTSAEVDVAADFKGGINVFREKVSQNFDTEAIDKTGVVSAVITFVVETNGSISNLKITGDNSDFNSEAEKAVKSVKTKWTPAQLKGKAVRSSFRMPISMKIE